MTNQELNDSDCGWETKIAPTSSQCGGRRTTKDQLAVEVRPDEELPADFCVSLRRILVPTALDKVSAVALDYASALARRFGSELALLYAFEGSDYAQNSCVEAKLWACFSTIRLRHLKARVFLRPGPTGEQVATVAKALVADLIVTSYDYYHRFLSYLTQAGSGILRVQGIPCPVVLVNAMGQPTYAARNATNRNALCSCRPGEQSRCLQASEGGLSIANFITGLDGPFRLALSGNDLFPVNSEAGTVNENYKYDLG